MRMQDIFYTALAVIASIGGSSSLIIGLSSWLGKVWANRILEKDKLKYSSELEKVKSNYMTELEEYKLQLEKSKMQFLRYSEQQFTLYNDLYRNLYDLKIVADNLWAKADFTNLKNFSKQLKTTKDTIGKSMLLIEDQHYIDLNTLVECFGNYQIGKSTLIELRNKTEENTYLQMNEIEELIQKNHKNMDNYNRLIVEIGQKLKEQIRPRI